MPILVSTGWTANELAICGNEVLMIAPSRFCMKNAPATISAMRRAAGSSFGAADCWGRAILIESACADRSMQARPLLQSAAVDRGYRHVEGVAIAVQRQCDVDAGRAKRPEPAIEIDLAPEPLAIEADDNIVGLELGTGGRAARRDIVHDDLVVDLHRADAEPRPCRLVEAAEFPEITDNRLQQV